MPWREANLRGQRVLARVKADGTFDEKNGRVEIRYRETDSKAYQARAANLMFKEDAAPALLADETCPPADKPSVKAAKNGAEKVAEYKVSDKTAWIAYTDGACTGNPGPAGSGTIVIAPGGKISESFTFLGDSTNNVAELTAIEKALEKTPNDEPLVVHTDSKYAIGVLDKGWKAKANTALIERMRVALRGRKVRFVYVPAHTGIPLNERADELAREAIRARRSG